MSLSTFWNHKGELHQLEGIPQSFDHWEPGKPLEDIQRVLIQKVESLFGKEVVRTDLRGTGRNFVLEVTYSDGRQDILRMPTATTNSDGDIVQDVSLFTREIALLQWLEASKVAIPVPRVRAMVNRSDTEPYAFSAIEKMPGDCILNVFGAAPFDVKESIIRNMANFMLQLSSVDVPQRIGSTSVRGNVIELVPLVPLPSTPASAPRVFDTLEEYLAYLVQLKRDSDGVGSDLDSDSDSNSDDDSRTRANAVLDRLLVQLPPMLERLSSTAYRRCVLNHDDLNDTNVLVNSRNGAVTGIIDWEYQSARPAVLAAQYPCCLRYDGLCDPRFAPGNVWWLASPEDAARLRAVYAEVVKARDEDYWRALVDGELLRQVCEWLTDRSPDPGCAAMGRWMDEAFGP